MSDKLGTYKDTHKSGPTAGDTGSTANQVAVGTEYLSELRVNSMTGIRTGRNGATKPSRTLISERVLT